MSSQEIIDPADQDVLELVVGKQYSHKILVLGPQEYLVFAV